MGKTARKTFWDVFEIRKPFQMRLRHFFIKMPPNSNAPPFHSTKVLEAVFAMYGYLPDEKGVATMCKIMEDMRNEAAQKAEQNKAKKRQIINHASFLLSA